MRKFLSVLLVYSLLFSFTACGSEKISQGSGEESTGTSVQESSGKDDFSQEENISDAGQISESEGSQKNFENGDITYCEAHHNMAIFYAQTDHPDLSVNVIPIGRVTSDLAVFENLDSQEEITFSLVQ